MIEHEPAFGSFDWNRTGSDLAALPCTFIKIRRPHHETVAAPVFKVGRLGVEYVPERSMTGIRRTREHGETAVDFPREHHPVTVVRQKGIFQLMECPEIIRPRHTYGRTMVAVAPCHIIPVIYTAHARVIAVDPLPDFRIAAIEFQGIGTNVPIYAVFRKSDMKRHAYIGVVDTENPGEAIAERHHSRIEDTVGVRKCIPFYYRISGIAPHHFGRACRTVLPRHCSQWHSFNLYCSHSLYILKIFYQHK